MRHYPASNLTPGHPNSLQNVKPKGAADWTSIINDEIAYVRDGEEMRCYRFLAASTDAEDLPDVVIPTGNATGTGRWHQIEWAGAGGGGGAMIDFLEQGTIPGGEDPDVLNAFTLRKYEDPFSIPMGDGTTTGRVDNNTPTWEGDIWKNQSFNSFIYHGTICFLEETGEGGPIWTRARANHETLYGSLFGMALGSGTTPITTGEILLKGAINHAYLGQWFGDIGTPLYLDYGSWGKADENVPTDEYWKASIQLGYMLGPRAMYFDPDKTILEFPDLPEDEG